MDYQLIRAYCAKDLNGILRPRDKYYSTPEARFEELRYQILFKHRTGARNLEPRQYAAAMCLSQLELLEVSFEADEDDPEVTEADIKRSVRKWLADALSAYVLHLSAHEAAPLLALIEAAPATDTARNPAPLEADAMTPSPAPEPQQTAPAQTTATPAPVAADDAPEKQVDAMKKAALIAKLEHEWSSIEADISDATRNGLKAAHTGKHGEWDADKARAWAVSKGKIKQTAPVHHLASAWPGATTRNKINR